MKPSGRPGYEKDLKKKERGNTLVFLPRNYGEIMGESWGNHGGIKGESRGNQGGSKGEARGNQGGIKVSWSSFSFRRFSSIVP